MNRKVVFCCFTFSCAFLTFKVIGNKQFHCPQLSYDHEYLQIFDKIITGINELDGWNGQIFGNEDIGDGWISAHDGIVSSTNRSFPKLVCKYRFPLDRQDEESAIVEKVLSKKYKCKLRKSAGNISFSCAKKRSSLTLSRFGHSG